MRNGILLGMTKLFNRIHIYLSHHSYLYALVVGVGIVLFWRGVWHTVDLIHMTINQYGGLEGPLDLVQHPWWDGPLSFLVGCIILYVGRAFVSSFIGSELIISGLRTEKKIAQKTEDEVKSEESTIAEIKETIGDIAHKLDDLEHQVKDHHK